MLLIPSFIFGSEFNVRILIAIVPAIFLLWFVYHMDKLEKEPPKLILSLVGFGMLACFPAVIAELIGEVILSNVISPYSAIYPIIDNFFIIALAEETYKFIFLHDRTWKRKEFNCMYDGIVYAISVSLGFALLENILYVLQFGAVTGLMRAITAVPGHASFGVFMGCFYGIAKKMDVQGRKNLSIFFRVLSLVFPVFFHGLYDYLATTVDSYFVFFAFIILMFGICLFMILFISKRDDYLIPVDNKK